MAKRFNIRMAGVGGQGVVTGSHILSTAVIHAGGESTALAFSMACSFQAQSTNGPGKIVALGLVNILRAISSMTLSSFSSSNP